MPLEDIIAQMETAAEESRLANIRRQEQVSAIFDEIIARYGPGGTFGKGAEAILERQKIGDVGAGAQRWISAGLYGTEVGGGLERAWESEVGAPARLRLEDIKMERLSQAQLGKAGFVERIEDVYPDYGMMAQLISQAANVPGAGGGYGAGGVGGGGGYAGAGLSPDIPRREYGIGAYEDEAWYRTTGLGAGGGAQAGERVTPGAEGAQPASWFAAQRIPQPEYGGYGGVIGGILGAPPTPRPTEYAGQLAQRWLRSTPKYGAL